MDNHNPRIMAHHAPGRSSYSIAITIDALSDSETLVSDGLYPSDSASDTATLVSHTDSSWSTSDTECSDWSSSEESEVYVLSSKLRAIANEVVNMRGRPVDNDALRASFRDLRYAAEVAELFERDIRMLEDESAELREEYESDIRMLEDESAELTEELDAADACNRHLLLRLDSVQRNMRMALVMFFACAVGLGLGKENRWCGGTAVATSVLAAVWVVATQNART
jgi:hypothetical protein